MGCIVIDSISIPFHSRIKRNLNEHKTKTLSSIYRKLRETTFSSVNRKRICAKVSLDGS